MNNDKVFLRVLRRVYDSTTDSGATPIGRMDLSIRKFSSPADLMIETMLELKVSVRVYASNRHLGATPIRSAGRAPYEIFDCDLSDQHAKLFDNSAPINAK